MGRYWKTIVASLGAALVAAQSVTSGHVTQSDWLNIAIAGLTAFGVWWVRNAPAHAAPDEVASWEAPPGDGETGKHRL